MGVDRIEKSLELRIFFMVMKNSRNENGGNIIYIMIFFFGDRVSLYVICTIKLLTISKT